MPTRTTCRKCGSSDVPAYRIAQSDYRCAPCLNADTRAYRATRPAPKVNRGHRRRYDAISFQRVKADPARRLKHMARMTARKAIARGRLVRRPCEVCGAFPVEAHHDDYSQPLNVRWLCLPHHREHHAAERALQRAA